MNDDLILATDNLLVQTALLMANQRVVLEMTLSVYKETLPRKNYLLLANNYIKTYEIVSNEVLTNLQGVLNDPSLILRQKMEVLSKIQGLKEQLLY